MKSPGAAGQGDSCNARARPMSGRPDAALQPRPMNGIFVAMIVMNCTFVSSGSPAM
jgi:hypothetical protein